MPRTEPNSLPALFIDQQDWRDTYAAYVKEFKSSPKMLSDSILLEIRLRRLGYVGANLQNELVYVKEND